ncbi:MAG: nucleotidyltransferase family protein [Clostridia bacterium]|nr:nucleotidyltransferase family protein [Clostridia bacterium]
MHIAVITEYNPFHMGHEYQLSEIRRAFPDATVTAIMGGIFSQRGEPYITTPYVRAEAALECGADLVLELPFPFSSAPAGTFTRAGVEIAAKIGADMLAFGSECGSIETLKTTIARLDSEELRDAVERESRAVSKTRTFDKVYKELYGEELASGPNDILAYEYMRAIKSGGYSIEPYTIKRVGDFKSGEGGFPSATSIRQDIAEHGIDALRGKVPPVAEKVYKKAYDDGLFGADIEKLSSAILLKLSVPLQSDIAYSSDGLLRHIGMAAARVKSVAELKKLSAAKHCTVSEISRLILYALFDVTREDLDAPVYITRIFGANTRGRAVIRQIKDIEVITKPSSFEKMTPEAFAQYDKNLLAERAFALCFEGRYNFLLKSPIIK